jgi:hypothetical protein
MTFCSPTRIVRRFCAASDLLPHSHWRLSTWPERHFLPVGAPAEACRARVVKGCVLCAWKVGYHLYPAVPSTRFIRALVNVAL